MDQLVNVLLAVDKACTLPQMALDCGPGLSGLNNQIYGPTNLESQGRPGNSKGQ